MSRGFTLIEVLVALALVTLATLALAQAAIGALRVNQIARLTTVATVAALQKMEQLRQSTLAPSPSDALVRSAPGYYDVLDAAGRTIDDSSPPLGAAFVRRWSVVLLPGTTFVLQVSVVPIHADVSPPAANAPRRPGEVRLVDIRTGHGS